jgi:hypothetical protein
LPFICENVAKVLVFSTINYLKTAELCDELFQENSDTSSISSVFTEFYVDHAEPLEASDKFKARGRWCLGELLEGHKYLALFPVSPLSPINLDQ